MTHPLLEKYLAELNARLLGMAKNVKKGIIAECRAHILDAVEDLGGQSDANFRTAINNFGSPKEVAAKYKEIYGYGTLFISLFAFLGASLSLCTLPLLGPASTLFIILIFTYIIYIGLKAGKKTGAIVGTTCALARICALAFVFHAVQYPAMVNPSALLMFLLASALMIPVGYLPGHTLEKYEEKKLERLGDLGM